MPSPYPGRLKGGQLRFCIGGFESASTVAQLPDGDYDYDAAKECILHQVLRPSLHIGQSSIFEEITEESWYNPHIAHFFLDIPGGIRLVCIV